MRLIPDCSPLWPPSASRPVQLRPLRSHRHPLQSPWPTQEAFVIAANPLAAQAGLEVLKRGGSAVDAAIAVQAMLSLVEPQSSGVGGGAFMTYYDARTGKVSILDGREVAPAQATSTMFLRADGTPLPFERGSAERPRDRRSGGRADACRRAFGARQAAVEQPVRRCGAHRARRVHRQPAPRPAGARRLSAEQGAGRRRLFPEAGRHSGPGRRPAAQPGLCRLPPAARRPGTLGALCRIDRGTDRRANARGAARRVDDHGRPRRLPAGEARGAVPARTGSTSCASRRRRRAASG